MNKFKDIFHKHLTVFFLILIEAKQPECDNRVNVNKRKLREFDFDPKKTLKAHKEIEDMKLELLSGNYNSNDNLDSDFCSGFSRIT